MKKFKSLALYALVLALTAVVLLAGCSNAADAPATTTAAETTTTTAAETTTTTAAEEETTIAEAGANGMFASVEEYLNNPLVKDQLDKLINSEENSDMTMTVTAEGNAMVYTYTFDDSMDLSTDEMKDMAKDMLDGAMESQKATFETILSQLRAAINPDVSIKIIYRGADGTEIASYDFK